MFFFAGRAAEALTGEAGLGKATFLTTGVDVVAVVGADTALALASFFDSFFEAGAEGAAVVPAFAGVEVAIVVLALDSFFEAGAFLSFFGLAVKAA